MAIGLDKKTGINLKKGSKISLEKNGKTLEKVCIGLNWGAIKKKAFFNLLNTSEDVDLDGTVTLMDKSGNALDTVYYNNLRSQDGAIRHSGDDTGGDVNGDDGRDNEVIEIDLLAINPDVHEIYFFLNSYKGQDFADIPYSKIRVFEGTKRKVDEVMATLNLSADQKYTGFVSMVMGKLVKKGNGWEFVSMGEPVPTHRITETISYIQEHYF